MLLHIFKLLHSARGGHNVATRLFDSPPRASILVPSASLFAVQLACCEVTVFQLCQNVSFARLNLGFVSLFICGGFDIQCMLALFLPAPCIAIAS